MTNQTKPKTAVVSQNDDDTQRSETDTTRRAQQKQPNASPLVFETPQEVFDRFHDVEYVRGLTIPKTIPEGRVLVHNHIRHSVRTRCGIRGFRAWTQPLSERLEQCDCGWSGLPHYRVKDELRWRPSQT
jgi:hypothetical protein